VPEVAPPPWPDELSLPETMLLVRAAAGLVPFRPRLGVLGEASSRRLGAARLAELVLHGRVIVTSERGRSLDRESVLVMNAGATGDPLLDELLAQIGADEPRDGFHWVKLAAEDAQLAYWDRLVGWELVRDPCGPGDAADPHLVIAARSRIRRTLVEPCSAALRDVAFTVLVRMTDAKLFSVILHDWRWTPAALLQWFRDERDARSAASDLPARWTHCLERARDSSDDDRRRSATAAESISAIAQAARRPDD
jgi:Golgi phosphoprotein 3 (GPP34)